MDMRQSGVADPFRRLLCGSHMSLPISALTVLDHRRELAKEEVRSAGSGYRLHLTNPQADTHATRQCGLV